MHPLQSLGAAERAIAAHDLVEVFLRSCRIPRLSVVKDDARAEVERDLVLGGGGSRTLLIDIVKVVVQLSASEGAT